MIALCLRGVGYASHRLHFILSLFLLFILFFIYYFFIILLGMLFVSDSWVSWMHYYQVVVVTHVGEGRVFWCQPSLPSQESSVPELPNFGLLRYLCLHRRTTKFGLVTHMARGVFLGGQPQHCICTNASRRLSATAEFLFTCPTRSTARLWYGNVSVRMSVCLSVCLSQPVLYQND